MFGCCCNANNNKNKDSACIPVMMMTESLSARSAHLTNEAVASAPAVASAASTPSMFPCLEQPIKAYLTSSAGRRLVSQKDGTVVAKPSRTTGASAEFFLLPVAGTHNEKGGAVTIKSVSHGRYLSVATCTGTHPNVVSTVEREIAGPAEEWKLTLTKQTHHHHRRRHDYCLLANATGVQLACCNDTGVLFTTPLATKTAEQPILQHELWSVEFLTGELLFMSNPVLDVRMRCDLVGMVSLTPNWKGWEVWRFIETGVQGQIRINSWMHNQRYLTSSADGKVTTIAASTLDKQRYQQEQQQQQNNEDSGERMDESLWTVEAAPDKQGCILRSVAYNQRILACRKVIVSGMDSKNNNFDHNANNALPNLQLQHTDEDAVASSLPSPEETNVNHRSTSSSSSLSSSSFSRSIASLRERAQPPTETLKLFTEDELELQKEKEYENNASNVEQQSFSFVWHLEAAHSQRYSLSTVSTHNNNHLSVGPAMTLTENRRQMEIIRLAQQHPDKDTVTLFLEAQQQYLGSTAAAAASDGGVVILSNQAGESEHWQMQVGKSGGYTFQSQKHGGFLSYREKEEAVRLESESNSRAEEEDGKWKWSIARLQKMAKEYNKKETVQRVLCTKQAESFQEDDTDDDDNNNNNNNVTDHHQPTNLWRLDPILPRAVSSSKIKTFAIGTSIAVGTTIAMPFACAGIVGLMGTEMGILANIVTVGLTSAEAIASVGVIGTTAALVFREDGDSLAIVSDGDTVAGDDDESQHKHDAFLKRPFCNWRVW